MMINVYSWSDSFITAGFKFQMKFFCAGNKKKRINFTGTFNA